MKRLKTILRFGLFVLLTMQGVVAMAQHYVSIGGSVDSTLVLPKLGSDSAYLVNESLTVMSGGTLQVEAGTKLFFGQSAYLRIDGGSLLLDGHADDSIYLLCYELSHDWSGIQLKNVTEEGLVRLSYVSIMGALTALNASACANVTIRHCAFNNFYAGKGVELVDCSDFLVDSCFFYQCISGIELKAKSSHCEDNRFINSIFDKGQINIEVSNVGLSYKCHNNVISGNCFQGATTAISFESIGGLSDIDPKNYILNNLISSDLPEAGAGYSSYGIKAAMDSLVIRNNVFWRNDEAITMLRVCHMVFEHNTFYDNGMTLANLLMAGSASFVGNTFCGAQRRIVNFSSGKSRLNGNNFLHYRRTATLFANVSSEDIDMRGNYWDTQSPEEIEALIVDKHDAPSLGEVFYDGYLAECDTTVPISPPYRVKKQFVNGSWLISWEDNPEQDIDHYVLFHGDFNYYKFAHHIDSIFGNSYVVSSQQADNVAIMACDRAYDPDVYASVGQSAYAFATYYPYAGDDGELCAPQAGFEVGDSNIPYTYNRFVWRTSGSGVFSDTLALRPIYYPSEADFDAGEVALTLHVFNNGALKTDEMHLRLYKELKVFAGDDYYGGLDRPISLDEAWAENYNSLSWHTLGDGVFDDFAAINTTYHPGELDARQRFVTLVLEAWSHCGHACDTIHFDLYEEFSLEGTTWSNGVQRPNTQVIAAGVNDGNPFMSGFYRTVSDETGGFSFESLLPDLYVLYAFPDTVDMTIAGSYYLGDLQWNESNMILVDGDVYDVDIHLPEMQQGFAVGEGKISGVFDYPDLPFKAHDFYCSPWLREEDEMVYCSDGLSNVGVLLLNATKERILGFTLTDASGAFRFTNLPFGTYYVMADLPRYGRGMTEKVEISFEQPVISGLHLYIDENKKVAMRHQAETVALASVFPNPVNDVVSIVGLKVLETYLIKVVDMQGNQALPQLVVKTDLLGECQLFVDELPRGLYFLCLESKSGYETIKFVKY